MTVTFTDARRSRGEATRKALMDAAESLIAENDSYAVPLREIVKRAGQKNESALQYHFGNLQGLVSAINERRWLETRQKRGEMLSALLQIRTPPTIRELCSLMVLPEFLLAKESTSRRLYIATFSLELAKTPFSAIEIANQFGGGGESGGDGGEGTVPPANAGRSRRARAAGRAGAGQWRAGAGGCDFVPVRRIANTPGCRSPHACVRCRRL